MAMILVLERNINLQCICIDVTYKKKGREIVIEILAIRSQNIFVNAHFEYFCEEKINESLHTSINNIKSYEVHVYVPAQ